VRIYVLFIFYIPDFLLLKETIPANDAENPTLFKSETYSRPCVQKKGFHKCFVYKIFIR